MQIYLLTFCAGTRICMYVCMYVDRWSEDLHKQIHWANSTLNEISFWGTILNWNWVFYCRTESNSWVRSHFLARGWGSEWCLHASSQLLRQRNEISLSLSLWSTFSFILTTTSILVYLPIKLILLARSNLSNTHTHALSSFVSFFGQVFVPPRVQMNLFIVLKLLEIFYISLLLSSCLQTVYQDVHSHVLVFSFLSLCKEVISPVFLSLKLPPDL
jgi:hypothetical protein